VLCGQEVDCHSERSLVVTRPVDLPSREGTGYSTQSPNVEPGREDLSIVLAQGADIAISRSVFIWDEHLRLERL